MKTIKKDVDFTTDYTNVYSAEIKLSDKLLERIKEAGKFVDENDHVSSVTLNTRDNIHQGLYFNIETEDDEFRIGTEGISVSKYNIWYRAYNKFDVGQYFEVALDLDI